MRAPITTADVAQFESPAVAVPAYPSASLKTKEVIQGDVWYGLNLPDGMSVYFSSGIVLRQEGRLNQTMLTTGGHTFYLPGLKVDQVFEQIKKNNWRITP